MLSKMTMITSPSDVMIFRVISGSRRMVSCCLMLDAKLLIVSRDLHFAEKFLKHAWCHDVTAATNVTCACTHIVI